MVTPHPFLIYHAQKAADVLDDCRAVLKALLRCFLVISPQNRGTSVRRELVYTPGVDSPTRRSSPDPRYASNPGNGARDLNRDAPRCHAGRSCGLHSITS
jgi:hypothetical protein